MNIIDSIFCTYCHLKEIDTFHSFSLSRYHRYGVDYSLKCIILHEPISVEDFNKLLVKVYPFLKKDKKWILINSKYVRDNENNNGLHKSIYGFHMDYLINVTEENFYKLLNSLETFVNQFTTEEKEEFFKKYDINMDDKNANINNSFLDFKLLENESYSN